MRRRALLVALPLALAGCNGGTVDRKDLTKDTGSIDSMACEGALIAKDLAKGATTKVFVRIQAGNLRGEASNLEDALATRPTATGIEAKVRKASRDAEKVELELGQLNRHPTNRALAERLERKLKQDGSCP